MASIPINLAVEDALSEFVLLKILAESGQSYAVGASYNRGGFGYLKKMVKAFNQAARGMPYVVLTDLDRAECPAALIDDWLSEPKHPNLLLRVAVREVEAWLLAHREGVANFLGIRPELIPLDVDQIDNPKQFLVNLARKSRSRKLREAIVPRPNSTAQVGPDYNGQLIYFVDKYWQLDLALPYSPSLQRTVKIVASFEPIWEK